MNSTVLHTYKRRLTNLSQGNRSLKLGRIRKRREIDWKSLGFLESKSTEEMLAQVLAGKSLRLLSHLDPRHERTNLMDRHLNYLFRELRTLFEETGNYDLYFGYPFVEGKFLDGTVARCPLVLFPVRLHRNLQGRPRWKLTPITEEPILFNKTFFLAYEQFQQHKLPETFWETELEHTSDWQAWLNELYAKLKEHDLAINFNQELFQQRITEFPNLGREQMDRFKLGELKLKPYAVLGIFPQSESSLLQDYEQLETQLEKWEQHPFFSPAETATPFEPSPAYVKEENRFYLTEVDQSQEQVLLDVHQGTSMVVHGPPGTGKSQVIVNLIADAMAHGKRVLLVSQKRAALDVVYKRLEALGLGRFSVLVHDYRHDRKAIFQKIKQQIDDIDEFKRELADLNLTRWEHDYKLLSRQIDQQQRRYQSLYEALTDRTDTGYSAHELYVMSKPQSVEQLPMQELAGRLDNDRLAQLEEKFRQLLLYQDLLADTHPWKHRLSFQHYQSQDKAIIAERLQQLEGQLNGLRHAYHPLKDALGISPLNPSQNADLIKEVTQIHALLEVPGIRSDVQALLLDTYAPDEVETHLNAIDELLEQLDEAKLLRNFSWALYSNLEEHLFVFKAQYKKPFRFLSIKFHRAKWFLQKITPNDDLDGELLQRLLEEFRPFQQLKALYGQLYEHAFFQDFPLVDKTAEKAKWVSRKKNHLRAFRRIMAFSQVPALQPIFEHGKLHEAQWTTSRQLAEKLNSFNNTLRSALGQWEGTFHKQQILQLIEVLPHEQASAQQVQALQSSFATDYGDLKQLDMLLASFSSAEIEVLGLLETHKVLPSEPAKVIERVRQSLYVAWIELLERNHPVLTEVSGRAWDQQLAEFPGKLNEKRSKVGELVRRRLKEEILGIITYNRLKNPITYRVIHHQVSKKRQLWSIRRLVRECWDQGLQQLMPCWMASPESASAIFPMEPDFFDLIIFDEASQCFVERGLPVMLRARQNVIAGDAQQLQPLNLYQVKYESDEEEQEDFQSNVALEVESLLGLAQRNLDERYLTWHYRSEQESLIHFSNQHFYQGKLKLIPPATRDPHYAPELEWVRVEGIWQQSQNLPEAQAVITRILELAAFPDAPSVGVVTFNYQQQELIRDLLEQKLQELVTPNIERYQQLVQLLEKQEGEDFQGLFVKNIENVQGDERDVIIFSVGYAPDERGKLAARFGLLNQQGGENRLNVAVTRARKKIVVMCSFEPEELQVEHVAHGGPKLLKSYLRFVQQVSQNTALPKAQHLQGSSAPEHGMEIAQWLAQALTAEGYTVEQPLGNTAFKLDVAVKSDDGTSDYLLGIACEGSYYFQGNSPKEREAYRPAALQKRGWNLHRVWARNFWLDPKRELEKVVHKLKTGQ